MFSIGMWRMIQPDVCLPSGQPAVPEASRVTAAQEASVKECAMHYVDTCKTGKTCKKIWVTG